MKKETIFKYELNESIQADAALNCLKNRNKHKQINEVAPVVAAFKKRKKSVKSFKTAREEQEEITGDKADYAMKLVKKFENDVPKIYKSTPEVFMMEQLLKVIGWDISKKEYNEWWELLCDACEEVFGSGYREWSKYLLDAMEEQEELPQMERHDMILALAEYMAESWIYTGDDGDLDDIYYAIADILDETGDYPASTDWEDCKPWCQKYYKEVEARIY